MVYNVSGTLIGDLSSSEPKRYRILQYNVGAFNGNGYSDDSVDEYIGQWKSFLGSTNSDICLLTNPRPYINANNTLAKNYIYSIYPKINIASDIDNGKFVILSNSRNISSGIMQTFENQLSVDDSIAGIFAIPYILNGTLVVVGVVSLAAGDTAEAISMRALQIEELSNFLENVSSELEKGGFERNFIIGGDFNAQTLDEYTSLFSGNPHFQMWPLDTYPQSAPNLPFNNIFVIGPAITLQFAKAVSDCTLSNYCPVIADIIIQAGSGNSGNIKK